ncbi:hypothetical protein HY11_11605 [Hyphomonas pacifica]|nr:hypothetical protein HY11_11605 [Hyphomonas pacifica]
MEYLALLISIVAGIFSIMEKLHHLFAYLNRPFSHHGGMSRHEYFKYRKYTSRKGDVTEEVTYEMSERDGRHR